MRMKLTTTPKKKTAPKITAVTSHVYISHAWRWSDNDYQMNRTAKEGNTRTANEGYQDTLHRYTPPRNRNPSVS